MKTIYQDDYLKVIDKPAGIISAQISPLICHRLDEGTSGLLIIAKNSMVKQAIQRQFKARLVKKTYLALVSGIIPEKKGRIEGYIVRHKKKGFKRRFIQALEFSVKEKHKRLAVSAYEVKKIYQKKIFKNASQKDLNLMTLVKVRIFTGRTHQIRAQFAAIHHPVVGDLLYGGKLMRKINAVLGLNRQFLHAQKLIFRHPINNKKIILKSNLPRDLKRVVKELKKSVAERE